MGSVHPHNLFRFSLNKALRPEPDITTGVHRKTRVTRAPYWLAAGRRSSRMRDANYLHAQAELCLEIARQVSDQAAAENLRAEAARYQDEAAAIEAAEQSEKS
jgi:hypothetical protein